MTDIQKQYKMVREKAGLLDRSDVGKLAVYGADRLTWLQGMVSNDLRLLTQQSSDGLYTPTMQACILDATGHILTDLRLVHIAGKNPLAAALGLKDDDFVLMDLPRSNVEKIAALLDRFIITEDVELMDVSDKLACYSIQTSSIARLVSDEEVARGTHVRYIDLEPFVMVSADHTGTGGRDCYTPIQNSVDLKRQLLNTSREVEAETQEILRVEAGIPKYGVDMDETTLAPEAGLMGSHISLTKGCYVGQEIVARIDSRGHTNRALTGLVFDHDDAPMSGDKIITSENGQPRETGRITSAIAASPAMNGRPIALGYVRHEHRTPGSMLEVAGAERTRQARVVELPFYRRPE